MIIATNLTTSPLSSYVSNGNQFNIDWSTTGTGNLQGFVVSRYISDPVPLASCAPPIIDDFQTLTILASTENSYSDNLLTGEVPVSGQDIVDDILNTKRQIYYMIRAKDLLLQEGKFDTVPYVIIAHTAKNIISNRSTKTQVKYNVLYEEGDRVWSTSIANLVNPTYSPKGFDISRTAVGPPTEYVYVGSRKKGGNVFKLNLNDGTIEYITYLERQGWLSTVRALAVHPETGECIVGGGGGGNKLYGIRTNVTENTSSKNSAYVAATPVQGIVELGGLGGYGGVIAENNNKHYYYTMQNQPGKNYVVKWDLASKLSVASRKNMNPYGITAGLDGQVFTNTTNNDVYGAFPTETPIEPYAGTNDKHSRGCCTDLPLGGSDNYNLWAASEPTWGVWKIPWNSSAKTFGTPKYYHTPGIYGVGPDSENSIWGIGYNSSIYKIYQTDDNTNFPSGGNCRYSTGSYTNFAAGVLDHKQGGTNEPQIEYFLTRDPDQMTGPNIGLVSPTDAYNALLVSNYSSDNLDYNGRYQGGNTSYNVTTRGTKIVGSTLNDQIAAATNWINTYGADPLNQIGRKLYPNFDNRRTWTSNINAPGGPYTDQGNWVKFPIYHGGAYCYSDFTGAIAYQATDIYVPTTTTPTSSHPLWSDPVVDIDLQGINSTPILDDKGHWYSQISTINGETSGYDDFEVEANVVGVTGTFEVTGYQYNFGDRIQDIGGDINYPLTNILTTPVTTYTYHDPSQNGKPGNRTFGSWPNTSTGVYTVTGIVYTNINAYTCLVASAYDTADVTVWERWPTENFYLTPYDTPDLRQQLWGQYVTKPVGDNGEEQDSPDRVIYGTDPLSAQITDTSQARTWPISSWYVNWGDPLTLSYFAYTHQYLYQPTNVVVEAEDDTVAPRDASTTIANLTSHTYHRPGTYYVTVYNEASVSNTQSADLDTMYVAVTREVEVREYEPYANFQSVLVQTVSSNYSDDAVTPIDDYLMTSEPPVLNTSTFISGYAPNLTVVWQDTSVPHSFPISSYNWNFGDWYNELDMTYSVTASNVLSGYPVWKTDVTNHTARHVFTMPGIYDVTLCVEASTTSTQNCSGKSFYVFVDQIPPVANFTFSPVSGVGPTTVTFNPSGSETGSFPFCVIVWDFGDGNTETISRVNSAEANALYTNSSAFSADLADPRNVLIEHEFTRTLSTSPSIYTVCMSAFACNTNAFGATCFDVGPFELPDEDVAFGTKHIIGSRLYNSDDELLVVFEGENSPTFNVLLSAE